MRFVPAARVRRTISSDEKASMTSARRVESQTWLPGLRSILATKSVDELSIESPKSSTITMRCSNLRAVIASVTASIEGVVEPCEANGRAPASSRLSVGWIARSRPLIEPSSAANPTPSTNCCLETPSASAAPCLVMASSASLTASLAARFPVAPRTPSSKASRVASNRSSSWLAATFRKAPSTRNWSGAARSMTIACRASRCARGTRLPVRVYSTQCSSVSSAGVYCKQ